MKDVYIITAHSPHSPGGVWGDRSEYADSLKLSLAVKKELQSLFGIDAKIIYGREYSGIPEDAFVFSFHRDGNMKNCRKTGASVYVNEKASANVQFDAFRFLECFTGNGGFRYLGVHTSGKGGAFRRMFSCLGMNTFVFTLGFMDEESENLLFDENLCDFARLFADTLYEILKEKEYETDAPFYKTSGRGEQFENTENCA